MRLLSLGTTLPPGRAPASLGARTNRMVGGRLIMAISALRRGNQSSGVSSSSSRPAADAAPASIITVQSGESLAELAARHGVSVNKLKSHNRIKGAKIFPGQQLRVPKGVQGWAKTSQTSPPADRATFALFPQVRPFHSIFSSPRIYRNSVRVSSSPRTAKDLEYACKIGP